MGKLECNLKQGLRTYMTLDACNEKFINVGFGILNEVWWGLFCGDGNERDTFVCWFKPDNLGPLNRSATRFFGTVSFPLSPFCFLLLLGGSRRRTKETQSAGEKLARHALNNRNNMAGELGPDFVGDPIKRVNKTQVKYISNLLLVFEEHQSLTFDFDIILLFIVFASNF